MLILRLLATCVVFTSFIGHVVAVWGSRKSPALQSNAASNRPLVAPPVAPADERKISLSDSLLKVQQIVETVNNMPSCKKLAAWDLVHSCESFEDRRNGQQVSGDSHLETLQKLFAIRMSNCEQLDANDVLPDVCHPLMEIDIRSTVLPTMISSCLEALNSGHPNKWTTYRHAKLEGTIMCTAMRAEVNKDDQIHLFQVLLSAMTDVNGAIMLQREEVEAVLSGIQALSGHMRDFQYSLLQDNLEMRAQMMNISVELTGSMMGINEGAQVVLQVVRDLYEHALEMKSELGSAVQLANSRNEETDAQWLAILESREAFFGLAHERFEYSIQNLLDSFHGSVYNMSQSIETANEQTSALAGHLGGLSLVMMNLPTKELANLSSTADELVVKHQLIHDFSTATFETVEKTHKLVTGVFDFTEVVYAWIRSALGQSFIFAIYFILIFTATLSALWSLLPYFLAFGVSIVFAAVLSVSFAWIQTPATFVRSILAHHPTFFSPVIWSVLTSVAVGVFLSESARQVYQHLLRSARPDYELQLPVKYDGVQEKV